MHHISLGYLVDTNLCDAQKWNQKILVREKSAEKGIAKQRTGPGGGQLQGAGNHGTETSLRATWFSPPSWQSRWKGMLSFNLAGVREKGATAGCQPAHVGFWGSGDVLQKWRSCVSWPEVRASRAGEGTDSSKRRQRCERGPCSETLQVSLFPLCALHLRGNEYPHAFCPSNNLVLL